jgi:hypothetical protein
LGELYYRLYDRPDQPENLEVKCEEEVNADEKGPYILQREVQKAIKEISHKKNTEDDDVPEDILKVLGEDSLRILA